MKYDISRLKNKHDQLAFWLPDGKSVFSRFEDGTEGQPSAGDSLIDSPADPPTDIPADSPADPPVEGTPSPNLLEVAGLVNPDGSFVEDWHKSDKLPEDVRGSDSLGVIKNLADLAKIARGKITFWGEIDRQHVLVDKNPQAGRDAVRKVAAYLYDPSGGIIAQLEFGAGAHPETVWAVYEEWEKVQDE